MSEFTESEIKIIFQTEMIASVFAEWLQYYKPIYDKITENQTIKLNRANKKAFKKQNESNFALLYKTARNFARINERDFPEQYDKGIDLIHECLNNITLKKE